MQKKRLKIQAQEGQEEEEDEELPVLIEKTMPYGNNCLCPSICIIMGESIIKAHIK